jgi:hypothetical protein
VRTVKSLEGGNGDVGQVDGLRGERNDGQIVAFTMAMYSKGTMGELPARTMVTHGKGNNGKFAGARGDGVVRQLDSVCRANKR